MTPVDTEQLAHILNARCSGPLMHPDNVVIDSRDAVAGSLFVALVGARVDGHEFVGDAVDRGAVAALVERDVSSGAFAQLRVADAQAALWSLARWQRECFHGAVLALTASAGKTTIKECLRTILDEDAPVIATPGNRNNHLGVPLTILSLQEGSERLVLELGASAPGEIAALAGLARPAIGILGNALPVHIEGFGDVQTVATSKGEIIDALPDDGTAVLNLDSDFYRDWRVRAEPRSVLTFGLGDGAEVTALDICDEPPSAQRFLLRTPLGEAGVRLSLAGRHNISNALAAAAAATVCGLTPAVIASGLQRVQPVSGRGNSFVTARGVRVVDESYNANPESVIAALQAWTGRGDIWLLMGEMGELGEGEAQVYAELGPRIRNLGVARLLVVGQRAAPLVSSFGTAAELFADTAALLERLVYEPPSTDTLVVVKGSRSARMEALVEFFRGRNQ